MRVLHSADWHILLRKKKVPYEWQKSRFELLFDKLLELEKTCDIHIIAGDLFDKAPSEDEVALCLKYLNRVTIPTFIIPGNHEATTRGKSFLASFAEMHVINNDNVNIITQNERRVINGQGFQFFPYGEMQINNVPRYVEDDILVTHIRGEVPPHITAEFDFELIRPWKLVLIGDLHFNHQYKNYPVYYPGSPLNIVFDREENREYGVNVIDLNSVDSYTVSFKNLKLPKLLRRRISHNQEIRKDIYNHAIYEIIGSTEELASVGNSELIDKKIVNRQTSKVKLDLRSLPEIEELKAWMKFQNIEITEEIVNEYLAIK
jgi:DNA repair exonuclease SbcCD nuclease subunit